MNLNSDRLQAFFETVKLGSFTAAAEALNITQPSLSKRISLLEEDLQAVLVNRTKPITLTERGRLLYDHCLRQKSLEQETLSEFLPDKKRGQFSGFVRIAGLSSVIHSTVMPVLAPFLLKNEKVQVQFTIAESDKLSELLTDRKADFVFLDRVHERPELIIKHLGHEEMVLIESTQFPNRSNVCLDTGPGDPATSAFFRLQKNPPKYQRSFVHDTYGLLIGAALGIGKSVIDTRSIRPEFPIRIVPNYKPLKIPVVLHYYNWAHETALHREVLKILVKEVSAVY